MMAFQTAVVPASSVGPTAYGDQTSLLAAALSALVALACLAAWARMTSSREAAEAAAGEDRFVRGIEGVRWLATGLTLAGVFSFLAGQDLIGWLAMTGGLLTAAFLVVLRSRQLVVDRGEDRSACSSGGT